MSEELRKVIENEEELDGYIDWIFQGEYQNFGSMAHNDMVKMAKFQANLVKLMIDEFKKLGKIFMDFTGAITPYIQFNPEVEPKLKTPTKTKSKKTTKRN